MKRKPFISIVIPYYDDADSIEALLRSILTSSSPPTYEIIVVDDKTPEPFRFEDYTLPKRAACLGMTAIRQRTNRGPAAARNKGAKAARGEFLLFLDSDVELFRDTLKNLAAIYKDDEDIVAVTGVWVKDQKTDKFFPNFKALRDWSYWINERDKSGYYFLFSTRIASIKRVVFERLKGFDEKYSGALVEDIELTYRIARRYAIIFAPNVRVRHEFEDFWPIAKKYFWRAFYWTKLYNERKKFDPVATTFQEALTSLSGVATVFFGITSFFTLPTLPVVLQARTIVPGYTYAMANISYMGLIVSALLHIFLLRTFLVFAYKEKGLVFALKSFFTGLVLSCFISAGALWGRMRHR